MEFEATYEVTPALQRRSLNQYFFTVLLGWRILAFMLLIGGTVLLFATSSEQDAAIAPYVALGVTSVLLGVWIRGYYNIQRHGQNQLDLLDDNEITLRINSEELVYKTSNSERTFQWGKLDRVKESRDFIFLLRGKTPVLTAPKSELNEAALAMMRNLNADQGAGGERGHRLP